MSTSTDPYGAYATSVSPTISPKEKKLNVDIASGEQGIVKSAADIENDRNRIALDREKFIADLAAKGLMLDDKGNIVPRPGGSAGITPRPAESEQRTKALAQVGAARALDTAITDLEAKFYAGPGRTHGVMGAKDFLPTASNKAFDKAAQANRGLVKAALNLTGGELNTPMEAEAALGPYIPSSSSYDQTNLDAIKRLREKRDQAWQLGIQTLGGIPDVNGNVTPLDPSTTPNALQVAPWTEREQARSQPTGGANAAPGYQYPPEASALNQAMAVTAPLIAADTNAANVSQPIPPEMQQEHSEWLAAHPRGSVTAEDYAAFRNALDAKYGFSGGAHSAEDPGIGDFVKGYNGKEGINVAVPPATKPDTRNEFERLGGSAMMSPVGTAATTALSGTGMNLLDVVAHDQMKGLRELNPNAALVGDMAGAVGATSLINKGGTKLAESLLSKYAPRLYNVATSGNRAAKLARSAATDVTQGGIYGGAVEGDTGTGAISGGAGNLFGAALGKVGGRFLQGLRRDPEALRLMQQYGVPDLTVGQQLGGFAKSAEDAATSIPVVGDVINARRGESLLNANDAAFNLVGGSPAGRGDIGLTELARRRAQAYKDALGGHSFDLDTPEFKKDMADALAARQGLTEEFQPKFDTAVTNSISGTPIGDAGVMTGEQYQQAQRKLSGYKGSAQKPGFEQDFRDALSGVGATLRNAVEQQAPEVIPELAAADKMYRGEKILEDAVRRARKDVTGLGTDVFTPGHLTDAVNASTKRYPGGVPLDDFASLAQSVLPSKMPDSGTARRAMLGAMALGGVGAITGGGATAVGGGDLADIVEGGGAGAGLPLATLALLAAGGSRGGQRAISKALFDRPEWLRTLGVLGEKYAPKAGTASIPLIMQGAKAEPGEGRYDAETDTVVLPDGTRIHLDGTPVTKKAKGGRVAAKSRAELVSRYAGE